MNTLNTFDIGWTMADQPRPAERLSYARNITFSSVMDSISRLNMMPGDEIFVTNHATKELVFSFTVPSVFTTV